MDIVLLGSGNVATHLGYALAAAGHRITQVYSRTLSHVRLLADRVGAEAIDDISALDLQADVFIVAVHDDAIASVVGQLPKDMDGMVVHTSGTTSMDVLASMARYGVCYPLQTFSKTKEVDFRRVPLALEASDGQVMAQLDSLARSISDVVFPCDSSRRLTLHVAAVFACNFTNHLYAIAADLLERDGLAFDLIKPLLMETADKIRTLAPSDAQTGPAIRGDRMTMDRHIDFLRQQPHWQALYKLISEDIHARKVSSQR